MPFVYINNHPKWSISSVLFADAYTRGGTKAGGQTQPSALLYIAHYLYWSRPTGVTYMYVTVVVATPPKSIALDSLQAFRYKTLSLVHWKLVKTDTIHFVSALGHLRFFTMWPRNRKVWPPLAYTQTWKSNIQSLSKAQSPSNSSTVSTKRIIFDEHWTANWRRKTTPIWVVIG